MARYLRTFEAEDATGEKHTIVVDERPGGVCDLKTESGTAVNTLSQGWYEIQSNPPITVHSDDPNCPKYPA